MAHDHPHEHHANVDHAAMGIENDVKAKRLRRLRQHDALAHRRPSRERSRSVVSGAQQASVHEMLQAAVHST